MASHALQLERHVLACCAVRLSAALETVRRGAECHGVAAGDGVRIVGSSTAQSFANRRDNSANRHGRRPRSPKPGMVDDQLVGSGMSKPGARLHGSSGNLVTGGHHGVDGRNRSSDLTGFAI